MTAETFEKATKLNSDRRKVAKLFSSASATGKITIGEDRLDFSVDDLDAKCRLEICKVLKQELDRIDKEIELL